jgi:hypothetical protein
VYVASRAELPPRAAVRLAQFAEGAEQGPFVSTDTPAPAALHALPYVLPSQPQTGAYCSVQISGLYVQLPAASARPQIAAGAWLQN